MKRQEKTFFATVEGGEGAGKSLFVKKLSQALSSHSVEHVTTREPGGTVIAEKLRNIFHEAPASEIFTTEAEFCIVSAARAQHAKNLILPKIQAGVSVICDRFVDSSRVYQGSLGGLPASFIENTSLECTYGLTPDLTFLLDVNPALGLSRVEERVKTTGDISQKNRFDEKALSYHEKIRKSFLDLARKEPLRFKVLDASKAPDLIVEEALKHLKERAFL